MSIWGKIIGGAAGFVLGGPLGAMLGAGVGHAVDSGFSQENLDAADDATKKMTFTIGVIALSAKMAKADGHVTRDEIDAFKEVFHVPPHEVKNVGRVFDLARRDTAGFEAYAKQIAALFSDKKRVLEDLLAALFHIAKADGVVHPNELKFLLSVSEIFGFNEAEFAAIKARHLGEDKADPYTVLGVPHSASDEEIKKTYRTLIKEHHPDRLIADGLPEEFINIANEKLASINDAFDNICKQRGIN